MKIDREWGRLKNVVMHSPGNEVTYALFAPKHFLFERPFKYSMAVREHENLVNVLRENGVHVDILKDIVIKKSEDDKNFRKKLEDIALSKINFSGNQRAALEARNYLEKNIGHIDSESLFNAILMKFSINLDNYINSLKYPTVDSNLPLANLYFMRDQQAVSSGILMGRMRMRQRDAEPEIMEFIFKDIYNENVNKINDGFFEGGDFIPAGDFALIGTGNRTDITGAIEAIGSGVIDFDEIMIVRNPAYEFSDASNVMINMHLDTYFNIAGDGLAITSVHLAKLAHGDVYVKTGDGYKKDHETNLYDYIKSKEFNVIDLDVGEQIAYSSNFLTLDDRKIIAVDSRKVLKKLIETNALDSYTKNIAIHDMENSGRMFPDSKKVFDAGIDVIKIDLSEITGGYGGAHCMTCSLNRD